MEGRDIAERSDDSEVISKLKKYWGYSAHEPFEVIGEVNGYYLNPFYNPYTSKLLLYPENQKHNGIYINKSARVGDGAWVKVLVERSKPDERVKHKNPYLLQAVPKSSEIIYEIPFQLTEQFNAEGKGFLRKKIFEYYKEEFLQQNQKLEESARNLKKDVSDSQKTLDELKFEREQLTKKKEAEINQLNEEYAIKLRQQKKAQEVEFDKLKKAQEAEIDKLNKDLELKIAENDKWEAYLETLRKQMRENADKLLKLDLIDETQYNKIAGKQDEIIIPEGRQFSSKEESAKYIQAFMYKQDILYHLDTVIDFLALLFTYDLIVLAGDSGSGKTTLVREIAKAIGAKFHIIPVKPSWTSPEDLLGFYNPIEQSFRSTSFFAALKDAEKEPGIIHLICLDEMNLAKVEYYFADFLSALEDREAQPNISLFIDKESNHLISEVKNFLCLIDDAKIKHDKQDLQSFCDILRDDALNEKLRISGGFCENNSLLKYHTELRKKLSSFCDVSSTITIPTNVRFIGTINVDDTTHYLSPKVLDRAHVIRFSGHAFSNSDSIKKEIKEFNLDRPLLININEFERKPYPFDDKSQLTKTLKVLAKDFLNPLGIEFGFRTIRQALNYHKALSGFNVTDPFVLNNIILHKVLPKFMLDGGKGTSDGSTCKEKLLDMRDFLAEKLGESPDFTFSCLEEINRIIEGADRNDGMINYWIR